MNITHYLWWTHIPKLLYEIFKYNEITSLIENKDATCFVSCSENNDFILLFSKFSSFLLKQAFLKINYSIMSFSAVLYKVIMSFTTNEAKDEYLKPSCKPDYFLVFFPFIIFEQNVRHVRRRFSTTWTYSSKHFRSRFTSLDLCWW